MVGRAHLGFFIKTENLTGLPQVFCGQSVLTYELKCFNNSNQAENKQTLRKHSCTHMSAK